MNFANLDSDALIAVGFLVAVLVITAGVFGFVLTRKRNN